MSDVESSAVSSEHIEPVTDLPSAVRNVLLKALAVDGLVRGLHEVAKAIDGGRAKMVLLADSVDEAAYRKLVTALAAEKKVPVVAVESKEDLGEWSGLCKLDEDGKPRKVNKCGVIAITNHGEEAEGFAFIEKQL